MQNEEGVITELYIPRKWYCCIKNSILFVFCVCGYVFFCVDSNGEFDICGMELNVNAARPRTGWLLQRITRLFRLMLGIWMRMASTMAISPPLLSADSSVLRYVFITCHNYFFGVVCIMDDFSLVCKRVLDGIALLSLFCVDECIADNFIWVKFKLPWLWEVVKMCC